MTNGDLLNGIFRFDQILTFTAPQKNYLLIYLQPMDFNAKMHSDIHVLISD